MEMANTGVGLVVFDGSTETDAVEEEALARLYPWQCYTDDLSKFREFASLELMCEELGVKAEEVEYAVKHYGGNLGAFHFVKR